MGDLQFVADAQLTQLLLKHGGIACFGLLRKRFSRHAIDKAVHRGVIVKVARGRYALPVTDTARDAAATLAGVCSHLSAAAHWNWPVKTPATMPDVTVPRHRKVTTARRSGVILHWRDLSAEEITDGWVTSPVRTVIDCCLDLPFDEALAVFDSALRAWSVRTPEVRAAAAALPPRLRKRVLVMARVADKRSANPFESVLRAIALGVPGLNPQPQVPISDKPFFAQVDLADVELRIVLEADSFEFHGQRKALDRDCRRYNGLVIRGWLVLRFSWEQVMFEPERVRDLIAAAVALQRSRRSRSTSTGTKCAPRAITA